MVNKTSGFICDGCGKFYYYKKESIKCEISHRKDFDFKFKDNNGLYVNNYGLCGQVESFIINKEIYETKWFGEFTKLNDSDCYEEDCEVCSWGCHHKKFISLNKNDIEKNLLENLDNYNFDYVDEILEFLESYEVFDCNLCV